MYKKNFLLLIMAVLILNSAFSAFEEFYSAIYTVFLNCGHYIFTSQKNVPFENRIPKSKWVQPSPPVFHILELEWTQWHQAKKYGRKLFKSKNLKKFYSRNDNS